VDLAREPKLPQCAPACLVMASYLLRPTLWHVIPTLPPRTHCVPNLHCWQMVAHDVFRAPAGFGALCVLAGSGLQVLLAGSALPLLTWLGLGGPGHRGVLTSSSLVLLALAAYPAGRAAGGLWKRYSRTGGR
jgi:hypothetical protein